MKKIHLLVHPAKSEARTAADRLSSVAVQKGLEVSEGDHLEGVDAVVALGGDGTILRAAALAFDIDVPLLGINLGHLGFLSTVDLNQIDEISDRLVRNDFLLEQRMMLSASASQGETVVKTTNALNEILIERGTFSRIVAIDVTVDDEPVATFAADGFIVSTPTGSTAYSLSAGGPVVEPSAEAIVLTSVSAHAPLWRSIVVRPDRAIRLTMPSDKTAFSADGQGQVTLEPGGSVSIVRHERPLKLVSLGGHSFYLKLRSRFRVEPNPVGR